ncbi:hypothetical protein SUGI_0232480 [Cryptomeria japonica]|nr:hypothetical protein SUGI_0232480 [Cryptomeria japonica]
MPNLVRLVLRGDDCCRELPKAFGKSGGFLHLRFFTIQLFLKLEEFPKLEEGAMACLEERLKRLKVFDYTDSGTYEIAASLASNTDLRKWETNCRQLEKAVILIDEHAPVMDILKLSYDSLPAHLKACFAYFSVFAEDENINCEYLVNLWIGEGFIPAGEQQWDMAWDWLDQLAQLCLLQLWENKEYNLNDEPRLIKYCNIHDLSHDLSIHISRENKCIFSVEEVSTHTSGVSGWCRILLAKKDMKDNAISSISHSCPVYLRTLSLTKNMEITSIPANLFTAMRGLRILDLSFTSISTLPSSIGKMILLKVLNLRRTKIKEVPECLRHLKSLMFLAIHWDCKSLG